MTKQEQNRTIAELCGWKLVDSAPEFETWPGWAKWGRSDGAFFLTCPPYIYDLNAMHEAEKSLTPEQRDRYNNLLIDYHERDVSNALSATAQERAEFFLRALGKWKD